MSWSWPESTIVAWPVSSEKICCSDGVSPCRPALKNGWCSNAIRQLPKRGVLWILPASHPTCSADVEAGALELRLSSCQPEAENEYQSGGGIPRAAVQ